MGAGLLLTFKQQHGKQKCLQFWFNSKCNWNIGVQTLAWGQIQDLAFPPAPESRMKQMHPMVQNSTAVVFTKCGNTKIEKIGVKLPAES